MEMVRLLRPGPLAVTALLAMTAAVALAVGSTGGSPRTLPYTAAFGMFGGQSQPMSSCASDPDCEIEFECNPGDPQALCEASPVDHIDQEHHQGPFYVCAESEYECTIDVFCDEEPCMVGCWCAISEEDGECNMSYPCIRGTTEGCKECDDTEPE
jgi:hypothetical protein